jgi:hypothetical protein
VLDLYAHLNPPRLSSLDALQQALAATPDLRVLTEVTTDRGKERRLAYLGQEFGFTVERRIDLPAPLSRSYAILRLAVR